MGGGSAAGGVPAGVGPGSGGVPAGVGPRSGGVPTGAGPGSGGLPEGAALGSSRLLSAPSRKAANIPKNPFICHSPKHRIFLGRTLL
jgi:hypothetical protein